jgi:N-acyl-D-aspartate/D-glutamate deacylase
MTVNTLLIRDGRIIDGTGNPWYKADLLVEDGRIAKIAPNICEHDTTSIDASNRVVSPGFIRYLSAC